MATKTTTPAAQEAAPTPAPRIVKCQVVVNKLELPHGIAARGRIVHIPEDVFEQHKKDGNVTLIDYVRN